MGASQGLNMLLNVFFGVTVNAAMGIANQVNSAVSSFVHNFQTAFNPQIVKSYAVGDISGFINLILSTSKYSFILLFIIALPIYICCPEVLSVWLTEVPEGAVSFCRLMLIFSLLDALQGPLWFSVQATGKIRTYQILMSFMILSNLPIAYLCLKQGLSPNSALVVRCCVNLATLFVRLWYLRRLFGFPVGDFFKNVVSRIVVIVLVAYFSVHIPSGDVEPIVKILVVTLETLFVNGLLIATIGLDKKEKQVIVNNVRKFYEKYKRG